MVGFSNPGRPMLLPPESMPWGRWIGGGIADNLEAITLAMGEQQNNQGLLNARADSLSDQIYSVDGLADISVIPVPDSTVSFAGGTSGVGAQMQYVFSNDTVIPVTKTPNQGFIFANFNVEWVSGSDPQRLQQVDGTLSLVGVSSIAAFASNFYNSSSADTQTMRTWATMTTSSSHPRGTTGLSYTARLGVSTRFFGSTTNPLTVKFSGCTVTLVQIGTLI